MRTVADILSELRGLADPDNVRGMARYGISGAGTLGVRIPVLRGIAKDLKPYRTSDPQALHELAAELWASGVHEARLLAGYIDVPGLVTPEQADSWVADMDSWDLVDQLTELFEATPFALDKVREWSRRDEAFVKRSAFALMCAIAVHDKGAPDEVFLEFLSIVEREADDDRNFVKKAVNWALRQIGKRNVTLHGAAVEVATRLRESGSKAARWVAADALRELATPAVHARLGL